MTKKLTEEQKNKLIFEYTKDNKTTVVSLTKFCNLTESGVNKFLRSRNIKIRNNESHPRKTYLIDESFFEKIDTQEKAYFLGLLYSDGCVSFGKARGGTVILNLQGRDKEILKKFKEALKTNVPLRFIVTNKIHHKRQNQYSLVISSKKMCQDLIKLGCVPRKSLILTFPTKEQVPKYLIKSFILGYFDGDGSVYQIKSKHRPNPQWGITILSTLMFLEELVKILKIEIGIDTRVKKDKRTNKSTRYINFGGTAQTKKFLDWLYENENIYLQRKHERYKLIKPIGRHSFPDGAVALIS